MSSVAVSPRRPSAEPILAQGLIERAFVQDTTFCTERIKFGKADADRPPLDGGFAMKRGIVTGALAEEVLARYGMGNGLIVDLGSAVDEIMAKTDLRQLPDGLIDEIRTLAISMVRAWQQRFPPDDPPLEWTEVTTLMTPDTDLFLRRPGRFILRVRPDNVVAVGNTLVAVEWSTAKNPAAVSPARVALNHHALMRERERRSEWQQYTAFATRVEMLSLGYGYTQTLTSDEAEQWRNAIASVAEVVVDGRYSKNQGAHCSTCPWQRPCWFSDGDEGEPF